MREGIRRLAVAIRGMPILWMGGTAEFCPDHQQRASIESKGLWILVFPTSWRMPVMNDLTPTFGFGVGEVGQAALEESRRIMRSAKGDRREASKLLLNKVRELGWITEAEQKNVQNLLELATSEGSGKANSTAAYFEARKVHHAMLAEGKSGPVALAAHLAERRVQPSAGLSVPWSVRLLTTAKIDYASLLDPEVGTSVGTFAQSPQN
jgi:hypothetical protein